jgi:nitrite reductase/ring-hydroxylating ferredoxin subunit
MQKYLFILFSILILSSCDSGTFNNRNPFIANYNFNIQINTDLPQYNQLTFVGSGVKIYDASLSSYGIIVFNTGSGYRAYDGACPNQSLSSCSNLSLSGINAVCSCDSAEYNLFTGLAAGKQYPLKPYQVEVNGSLIRIFN